MYCVGGCPREFAEGQRPLARMRSSPISNHGFHGELCATCGEVVLSPRTWKRIHREGQRTRLIKRGKPEENWKEMEG